MPLDTDPAQQGAQGASADPAASTATPPASQPAAQPGLSLADVQRLMAEERTRLTADFDQKQAQREAALRQEMAALAAGKKKPPVKVDPPADPDPLLSVVKPLEEDPAYQALLTQQKERDAKLAEIETKLKTEQGKREAAEEAAREQERFQSVFGALTDLENPARTDADGGQMAAKWLLSQYKIKCSPQTGGYFVAERDPATGTEKTTPIKEWIAQWGQTKEGLRFRPPLPPGAGISPGFTPGTGPSGSKRPLNDDEAITAARDHDRRRRQQMGRSSLN